MVEFNLSKNLHVPSECAVCKIDNGVVKVLFESDVKEFIRLLKEGLIPQTKEDFTEKYIREAIPRFIDKLVGDKLI